MESDRVRQRFDAQALTWDENPGRQALAKDLYKVLTEVVAIQSDWKVLDYGAGTGLVTLPLAAEVESVMAVDMSQEMLSVLAGKAKLLHMNVKTKQLDTTGGLELDVPVDLMVSTMVLHHVQDIESLLAKSVSWLKPGAYVALADLEPEDGKFHSNMDSVHHHGIDPDMLSKQLERLGFSICQVKRAHTVQRLREEGEIALYPIFLLVAKMTQ